MTEPERHLALSAADETFLCEYAGVHEATEEELAALAERSAVRDAAELAHALPLPAVAALLGTSAREVLAMTAGLLYVHELAGDGLRWPDWQFACGQPLPHLAAVVAAIPTGSHPTQIRAVMTTPDVGFLYDEELLSPRDWLLSGENPGQVVEVVRVLGEQI